MSRSESHTLLATAGSSITGFEVLPLVTPMTSEPQASPFPRFIVPVAQNRDFFGRRDVLNAIDQAFFSTGSPKSIGNAETRTFAICGAGGMGKTQVATEFVHSRRDRFDAIFWIHADSSLKLGEKFSHLAITLGLVAEDSADARDQVICRELFKGWLSNPIKSTKLTAFDTSEQAFWLLVFDNVDDTDVLEGFWPLDGPGCVLFTSRDPLAKNPVYLARSGLDLQPFTSAETSLYLEKLTSKEGDSSQVHDRLGGLPLAITQMASVIIRRDLSYSEFVESYDEEGRHEELFQLRFENRNQPSEYRKTIWSVWALESLKHSQALLDVLSILDPDGILESMLTNEASDMPLPDAFPKTSSSYQRARTELLQSSLITRDNSAQRLIVHRLVQDAARSKMDDPRFKSAFSSALQLVSAIWPFEAFGWRHTVSRWRACEELFPHVLALQRYGSRFPIIADTLGTNLLFARILVDAGW